MASAEASPRKQDARATSSADTASPTGTSWFHAASSPFKKVVTAAEGDNGARSRRAALAGNAIAQEIIATGGGGEHVGERVPPDSESRSRRQFRGNSKSPKTESRSEREMATGSRKVAAFCAGVVVPVQAVLTGVGSWLDSMRARIMHSGLDRPKSLSSSQDRLRGVASGMAMRSRDMRQLLVTRCAAPIIVFNCRGSKVQDRRLKQRKSGVHVHTSTYRGYR